MLTIGGVTAISLNTSNINRQLHAWKLLPEPERLTELYFTDHTKLPQTYTPGAIENIAFTVHNIELSNLDYTYSIFQQNADGSQSLPLSNGILSVADGESKDAIVPVSLSDLGQKSKLLIKLNTNEQISYWVAKV